METREQAEQLLRRAQKDIYNFGINKYRDGKTTYIALPKEKIKVPVSNKLEKDYHMVETTIALAQRMATAMVRETLYPLIDGIVNQLSNNIIESLKDKLPTNYTIIQQTTKEIAEKTKESFKFNENGVESIPINYGIGMELKGKTGQSTSKKDEDMDDILNQLSSLDSLTKS